MGSKLHWPVLPIQLIIPFPVGILWPSRVNFGMTLSQFLEEYKVPYLILRRGIQSMPRHFDARRSGDTGLLHVLHLLLGCVAEFGAMS